MITAPQIKALRTTVSRAGLDEAGYRLMLKNLGDVDSCKQLTQETYEDCMAILEDQTDSKDIYWREKVRLRGTFANSRLVHKINELFSAYETAATALGIPPDKQLKRPGLVESASGNRTNSPSGLTPHEAWRLIETLKAIVARARPFAAPPAPPVGVPPSGGLEAAHA